MRIDFATLAFGYHIMSGGGTPNWATALGQDQEYKIHNLPDINEIIKGMVYSSVPLKNITTKIGKGGKTVVGDSKDSPIVLASLFSKVYINNQLVEGGKFILLITRDTSKSHAGRLRIKYGPSNTCSVGETTYSNDDFFKLAQSQFDIADNACWFISDIVVVNQDELSFTAIIVNKDKSMNYENTDEQRAAWCPLMPVLSEAKSACGTNTLIYGVPGCGKSYFVKHNILDGISEEQIFRTVFHPDYTYQDFVGQIMPVLKAEDDEEENSSVKKVVYEFIPGPLTEALRTAIEN